jgi:FMN phosphatase YigB (HAD superfamily)
VFDVGDTLLRTEPLRRRALHAALGRPLSDDKLIILLRGFDQAVRDLKFPNLLFLLPSDVFEEQIGKALHFSNPESRAVASRYREEVRRSIQPQPVIGRMMVEAKQLGASLGIVSNGTAAEMEDVGYLAGLLGEVDFFASSEEIGHNKPDAQAFVWAEQILMMPSDLIVMVGNDLESDINGARRRGWKAVWVDGHPDRAPQGVPCIPFDEISRVPALAYSLARPEQ